MIWQDKPIAERKAEGRRFANARLALGYKSQRAMADGWGEKWGVSYSTINSIECGRRKAKPWMWRVLRVENKAKRVR